MTGVRVVFCTCPSAAVGRRIARTLVTERLAACVNRLAGVRSTYRWEGELREDQECLLVIKTTVGALPRLTERLLAIHPYDTPEFIALPVVEGNEDYLNWVIATANPGADEIE